MGANETATPVQDVHAGELSRFDGIHAKGDGVSMERAAKPSPGQNDR